MTEREMFAIRKAANVWEGRGRTVDSTDEV